MFIWWQVGGEGDHCRSLAIFFFAMLWFKKPLSLLGNISLESVHRHIRGPEMNVGNENIVLCFLQLPLDL